MRAESQGASLDEAADHGQDGKDGDRDQHHGRRLVRVLDGALR